MPRLRTTLLEFFTYCRPAGWVLYPLLLLAPLWACESLSLDQSARIFESEGRWDQALETWRQWEPESFCGTCLRYMHGRKEYHAGICLEHLGNLNESKQHYWNALLTLHSEEARDCAQRLLQLHQSDGTIAELRHRLSTLPSEAKESERYRWLMDRVH